MDRPPNTTEPVSGPSSILAPAARSPDPAAPRPARAASPRADERTVSMSTWAASGLRLPATWYGKSMRSTRRPNWETAWSMATSDDCSLPALAPGASSRPETEAPARRLTRGASVRVHPRTIGEPPGPPAPSLPAVSTTSPLPPPTPCRHEGNAASRHPQGDRRHLLPSRSIRRSEPPAQRAPPCRRGCGACPSDRHRTASKAEVRRTPRPSSWRVARHAADVLDERTDGSRLDLAGTARGGQPQA